MATENNVSTENNVTSQNTSVQKDENKSCCGICLTCYKSPRILSCNHIFCRLCLTKLVDKNPDNAKKYDEELVTLTCPLCRKEISLMNGEIDKLPMYFDDDVDDDDEDAGDDDDDVDADQSDKCVVCENNVPAEYECFQCQKLFCAPCKIFHDKLLKHEVKNLKLDLTQAQDKCVKHPEVNVGYFCLDCDRTLCKECVKLEHSLHQTQTLKSYLMEIDGELKDYSTNILQKFKTVEMSKVMFSSNRESKVLEHIKNVKNLGKDFEIELEKACRLNRINFMGKRIKKSKKQRRSSQNLISEIKELQAKITTHKTFYLPNNVDDIINNQIGMMDVQMGRLFVFQMKENRIYEFSLFFGNINWTLSKTGSSVILTPFVKPEDILLIESITTTVTFYVEGRDPRGADCTFLRKFTKTFQSEKDQLKCDYNYSISCVKALFQETNIKHRTQVE